MFIFLGKGHIIFIRGSQNSVMLEYRSFIGFGGKKKRSMSFGVRLYISSPLLAVVTFGKFYEYIVFQSIVTSAVKW